MVTFGPDFPDFPDFLSNFGRIVFDTVGAAGFALPCFDVVTLGIRKGTDAEEPCNRCQTVSVTVFGFKPTRNSH